MSNSKEMGKSDPYCDKRGLNKGKWTAEEDDRLINYIKLNGDTGSWRTLPQNAGLLRCGKSCRLRWVNYLREDVKRGNFTQHEDETIVKLHNALGNRWSVIARHLSGRTDNEIKNYWTSHLSRKLYQFKSLGELANADMVKILGSEGKKRANGGRALKCQKHTGNAKFVPTATKVSALEKGMDKRGPEKVETNVINIEMVEHPDGVDGSQVFGIETCSNTAFIEAPQEDYGNEALGPIEVGANILMDVANTSQVNKVVRIDDEFTREDWDGFECPLPANTYSFPFQEEFQNWDNMGSGYELMNVWSEEEDMLIWP